MDKTYPLEHCCETKAILAPPFLTFPQSKEAGQVNVIVYAHASLDPLDPSRRLRHRCEERVRLNSPRGIQVSVPLCAFPDSRTDIRGSIFASHLH